MKHITINGLIRIEGKEQTIEFCPRIYSDGSLLVIPRFNSYNTFTLLLMPFTPKMIMGNQFINIPTLIYEFSGNNIGSISRVLDPRDGVDEVWKLKQVKISITRYSDGVNMAVDVKTERGSTTWQGGIEKDTEGQVDPLNCTFELFISLDKLSSFLSVEQASWTNPTIKIEKFIKRINDFPPHTL